MRRDGVRLSLGGLAAFLVCTAASSCGSRTGLPLPIDEAPASTNGDGPGAPTEPGGPTGADGGLVSTPPPDLTHDAGPTLDALPPIDVAVPPSAPVPSGCADAGATYIYVVSEQSDLFSFDPPSLALTEIAHINCPATGLCPGPGVLVPATPFSMAVDQAGVAYVVYCDGELFEVSTADGHCNATGFASRQLGFPPTFGMAFAQDPQQPSETLYVAGDVIDGGAVEGSILGSIDTSTFDLTVIGPFVPAVPQPELTGNGAGGLFGFYAVPPTQDTSGIVQINPATAAVVANTPLPTVTQGDAWAFAFWGGDFYTFTAPLQAPWLGVETRVQRFSPSTGEIVDVLTIEDTIVGAGVSTCAPQL